MTDNEIIKSLKRIAQYSGFTDDVSNTLLSALDLINRQKAEVEQLKIVAGGLEQALKNVTEEVDRLLKECESKEEAYNKEFCLRKELKAEIERLKQENEFFRKTITENAQRALEVTVEAIETAKSEAIKEFAERLKDEMRLEDDCRYDCMNCLYECKGYVPLIDNLVKEMMEENK